MSAYVRHEFRRGFVLAEEHLRKLKELSSTRILSIDPELNLLIEVRRADSFLYRTPDVEKVVAEQNVESERILGIALKAERGEDLRFHLEFDEEDGASLFIVGADRDAVFLLYSDIKAYIDAEVLRGIMIQRTTFMFAGLVICFIFLLGSLMALLAVGGGGVAEAALASTSEIEKLNYLIKMRVDHSPGLVRMAGVAVGLCLPLLFLTDLPFRFYKMVFPFNCFLIGKQKGIVEVRRRWASNLFWVVLVGGVVSLATGYLLR